MKKDRDCNGGVTPYPIYPAYMPGMITPMITPNMFQTPNMMMQPNIGSVSNTNFNQNSGSTVEQQLYSLNSQVSSLERRISNLENVIGNTNTQYNTSNYQVM